MDYSSSGFVSEVKSINADSPVPSTGGAGGGGTICKRAGSTSTSPKSFTRGSGGRGGSLRYHWSSYPTYWRTPQFPTIDQTTHLFKVEGTYSLPSLDSTPYYLYIF